MICESCAAEADGTPPRNAQCPWCKRTMALTPKSGRLVNHKTLPHGGWQCQGFKRKPVLGHKACKGCDCHHQPVAR